MEKKNLIAVGGKTQGVEDASNQERKTDTTNLPVTYHGMPSQWYDELLHTFFAKLVFDLTPLDAKFAWQCFINRVGYVGICYTDEHEVQLYQRLKELLKVEMALAGSQLYNVQYAKMVNDTTQATNKTPKPEPKKRAKPKTAAAKAAAKARAAAANDGAAEEVVEEVAESPVVEDGDDDDVWDPLAGDDE